MIVPKLKSTPRKFRNKRLDHSFNGTLLIPDISGFTNFVNETEFTTGREITRQLLQVIVNNNILSLKISEIEGDAVLFYKNRALSLEEIKNQFEIMLAKFEKKVKELSIENKLKINLSLKMIVHYGKLSTYIIGDFEKLYGKTVIEAHNLLKNSISSASYLLLTDSVFKESPKPLKSTCQHSGSQLCEVYGNLNEVGYIYVNYENDLRMEDIKPPKEVSRAPVYQLLNKILSYFRPSPSMHLKPTE